MSFCLTFQTVLCAHFPPQWSDKPCAPHLIPRDREHAWTQQELKERLFQEIICYLDKGKVILSYVELVLGISILARKSC